MSFRRLQGVRLSEERQCLIYGICRTLPEQPKWIREKAERLCVSAGGLHHCALRELLTTERSVTAVARRYHVSEAVLYEARKRFYEGW
ncbi:MAG: hypothetical protein RR426_05470 [Oscillospiraceae bacterium]